MPLQLRRVVTGHNADGKAVVTSDEIATPKVNPSGGSNTPIWTTDSFPSDNMDETDGATRQLTSMFPDNGTTFRVVEFAPGNQPRMHRTRTLDYCLILSGEIDLLVDEGAPTHFKAGDICIQRGTMHGWTNKGAEPCSIAFITIDATSVMVAEKALEPTMH